MLRLMTIAALSASLTGCAGEATESSTGDAPATEQTAGQTVALASHTVKCGCIVDEVGTCGNYIEIGDEFVEIANRDELGLGVMEWCGGGEHTAKAAGEIVDGEFVASSFEVVD